MIVDGIGDQSSNPVPSLQLFPCPLWSEEVIIPVRVSSLCQMGLFENY